MKKIQAIRGMRDILPNESIYWHYLESLIYNVVSQYGYNEIRFPILEYTELFTKVVGEATDIVEKEMYSFIDKNGDYLSLRPEGTACCVRLGIEHGLFYNQIQKLFYYGPMFRRERPQKGRYRQLHQFGMEAYGFAGPEIEVEMLVMINKILRILKIDQSVTLYINTLGDIEDRINYQEKLIKYFQDNYVLLDEDSKNRLLLNPLRILDSKNPKIQPLLINAPTILEFLSDNAKQHFSQLCNMLDRMNISYVVKPNLVRGLDYYCKTVFEWEPNDVNCSQNVICAGGRYDSLVEKIGGKNTAAIGLAIGFDRLLSLVKNNILLANIPKIYLILLGKNTIISGLKLAEDIRNNIKPININVNLNGGDISTQLKRAYKIKATIALILGENELDKNEIIIKFLEKGTDQLTIKICDIIPYLRNIQD